MLVFMLVGEAIPPKVVTWSWLPFNVYQCALIGRVLMHRELDWPIRRAWLALILANLVSILGDGSWLLIDDYGESPVYHPIGDTFYLLEYPLYLIGLLLLPVARARGATPGTQPLTAKPPTASRLTLALDLLTVFAAATVVVWDTILRPAAITHADDPIALVFAAGPVIGDVVLLAGTTAMLSRRPDPSTGGALIFLAISMLLYAVIDLAYAAHTVEAAYITGGWLDIGWLIARLLLAVAALRQLEPPGDDDAVQRTATTLDRGAVIVPLAATAIGFVLIVSVITRDASDRGTLGTGIGAACLCALVLVRQTWSSITQTRLSRSLRRETDKNERLLLNILPAPIANLLKDGRPTEPLAETFQETTVLFADLVGFTPLSSSTPPRALVALLDEVFTRFDALAEVHGLEKIKTIGDAYMAAAGVPDPRPDHAIIAARMALGMREALREVAVARGVSLDLRIGLHSGPLVAGVIGQRKFAYDLWGDTVNTASRMESHAAPGSIQLSDTTFRQLADHFVTESRGELLIKGKGPMMTHVLLGERTPTP
jgi:class 3 adenylate cyclase